MKKEDKFKALVWHCYSQSKHYEQIEFQMINARKMLYSLVGFAKFSAKTQFLYCERIVNIANQSATSAITKAKPFGLKKEKSRLKYSLFHGFELRKNIMLKSPEPLLIDSPGHDGQ